MNTDLLQIEKKINEYSGIKQKIKEDLFEVEEKISFERKEAKRIEDAQMILQQIARETQENIKFHIETIVSLAIATIFGDEYSFKMDFVERRNKTECDLYLTDSTNTRIDPVDACGGGVVDVISFALRPALLNIKLGRKSFVLVLDESFKHLSADLSALASNLLKEISKKTGLQIILVTHNEQLIESADKVFQVSKKKNISIVEEINV